MVKQKVEGIFRSSVKFYPNQYYILKLQVNVMAHTKTLCDYLVFSQYYVYAVECKQVLLKGKEREYSFDRLTQKDALINFQNFCPRNKSYVFIGFITEKTKESQFFLIPLDKYLEFEDDVYMKRVKLQDFNIFLSEFSVPFIKGACPSIHAHLL